MPTKKAKYTKIMVRFLTKILLLSLLSLSVAQAQEFEFTHRGQTLKYKVTGENGVSVQSMDEKPSGIVGCWSFRPCIW